MKKVYITALHMRHGGIEMAISLLSNALTRKGYEVHILSSYNLGEPAYKLDSKVHIHYLTNVVPNREAFLKAKNERAFLRLLKEGFYSLKVLYLKKKSMQDAISKIEDGVIISTRNEHSVLLSKYGQKGVFKIAQLHHDHEFLKKFVDDFQNNYGNIDIFALLTDGLREEVEEMMQGLNNHTKCVTVPNFLDLVKSSADFEKKEKVVVTVGRLHPVKGFSRLIEAWKQVSERNPEWKLKIIGGGELEEELHRKVEELKLENAIELTGALEHDKVMEEMEKASLYVMTSYSEAFPFVLIETMSSGNPVVAFDVRVGPRAIIDHNVNGYLVEDNNLDLFAQKVEELLLDDSLRVGMGKRALEKAQCFSEEKVIEKWLALIND